LYESSKLSRKKREKGRRRKSKIKRRKMSDTRRCDYKRWREPERKRKKGYLKQRA